MEEKRTENGYGFRGLTSLINWPIWGRPIVTVHAVFYKFIELIDFEKGVSLQLLTYSTGLTCGIIVPRENCDRGVKVAANLF